MVSKVYFAPLRSSDPTDSNSRKIRKIFDAAGFGDFLSEGDLTAVKLHFGEKGNETYVNPVFVRQVVSKIRDQGAKPFLTDTNTLYGGCRYNAVDHLMVANEHGFDFSAVGAPLIIAGGLTGESFVEVKVAKKHIKKAKIARDLAEADNMIAITHLTGHDSAGFGGAVKNLAMGCATPSGKADQHSIIQPQVVIENCAGCGKCAEGCAISAITIRDGKSHIDYELCTGCGACRSTCPESALDLDWEVGVPQFIERMVEYAYGALLQKKGRIGFISFLVNITPDCDCCPISELSIVPDIGILASTDPIALDAASYDLVNQQPGVEESSLKSHHGRGDDKFKGLWEKIDGRHQIIYGEAIGLGNADYQLIEI
jgi:uncharacterized Fe-S center protein